MPALEQKKQREVELWLQEKRLKAEQLWMEELMKEKFLLQEQLSDEKVRVKNMQMKLAEVEKRYGKFLKIQRSEIEAREVAYFQKQPKWVEIQVESGSGVFPENADLAATTRRYTKNAVVEQLSIASY